MYRMCRQKYIKNKKLIKPISIYIIYEIIFHKFQNNFHKAAKKPQG